MSRFTQNGSLADDEFTRTRQSEPIPKQSLNPNNPVLLIKNRINYKQEVAHNLFTWNETLHINSRKRNILLGPSQTQSLEPNRSDGKTKETYIRLDCPPDRFIDTANTFLVFDVHTENEGAHDLLWRLKPQRTWADLIRSASLHHKSGATIEDNNNQSSLLSDVRLRTRTSSEWRESVGGLAGYVDRLGEKLTWSNVDVNLIDTQIYPDLDLFADSTYTEVAGSFDLWEADNINVPLVVDGVKVEHEHLILFPNTLNPQTWGMWKMVQEETLGSTWVLQRQTDVEMDPSDSNTGYRAKLGVRNKNLVVRYSRYGVQGKTLVMPPAGPAYDARIRGPSTMLKVPDGLPTTNTLDDYGVNPLSKKHQVMVPLSLILDTFNQKKLVPASLLGASALRLKWKNNLMNSLTPTEMFVQALDVTRSVKLHISNLHVRMSTREVPRAVSVMFNQRTLHTLCGLRTDMWKTVTRNHTSDDGDLENFPIRLANIGSSSSIKSVLYWTHNPQDTWRDRIPENTTSLWSTEATSSPHYDMEMTQASVGSATVPSVPELGPSIKQNIFHRYISNKEHMPDGSGFIDYHRQWFQPADPSLFDDSSLFTPACSVFSRSSWLPFSGQSVTPERQLTIGAKYRFDITTHPERMVSSVLVRVEKRILFAGDQISIQE